jgi:hypothetical protein
LHFSFGSDVARFRRAWTQQRKAFGRLPAWPLGDWERGWTPVPVIRPDTQAVVGIVSYIDVPRAVQEQLKDEQLEDEQNG